MAAVVVLAIVGGLAIGYLVVGRVRRHGGRLVAMVAAGAGCAALMTTIIPGLLPSDFTLVVGLIGLIVVIRPVELIRGTGGPRVEWEALRRGRELQVLVAEAGGPRQARREPTITDGLASLDVVAGPATDEYIRLVRATLLADRADQAAAADRERLVAADAALRASLGFAPSFEAELAARAEAAAK
jgi:hypothetical protein